MPKYKFVRLLLYALHGSWFSAFLTIGITSMFQQIEAGSNVTLIKENMKESVVAFIIANIVMAVTVYLNRTLFYRILYALVHFKVLGIHIMKVLIFLLTFLGLSMIKDIISLGLIAYRVELRYLVGAIIIYIIIHRLGYTEQFKKLIYSFIPGMVRKIIVRVLWLCGIVVLLQELYSYGLFDKVLAIPNSVIVIYGFIFLVSLVLSNHVYNLLNRWLVYRSNNLDFINSVLKSLNSD